MLRFNAIPTFYICLYHLCRSASNHTVRLKHTLVDRGIRSYADIVGYLYIAKDYCSRADIYVVADTRSLVVMRTDIHAYVYATILTYPSLRINDDITSMRQ